MASDPVPILGLTAAMAWISLVTVEFYERIYRDRIERYSEVLRKMGQEQRSNLAKEVERQVVEGSTPEENKVRQRQKDIDALTEARKILMGWRQAMFIGLFVGSVIAVLASYIPNFPIGSLTLSDINYVALVVLFAAGFLFLDKMFWYDGQINSAAQILRPLCTRCQIPMRFLGPSNMGVWHCGLCNERVEIPIYRRTSEPDKTSE